jgi:hypothetical protein
LNAAEGPDPVVGSDGFDERLHDLGDALSELAAGAEELFAKHPLGSVLAAFVLGIAIGRLIGRG